MEELQDAIEDAQYINAMNDDSPRPTKVWDMPAKEALDRFIEDIRSRTPDQLNLEFICSNSLGFYLFLRYVRESGDRNISNFLMEAAIYRVTPSFELLDVASNIVNVYLAPGSVGQERIFTEDNISREISSTVPVTEWENFMVPGDTSNGIGISGDPLNDCITTVRNCNAARSNGAPAVEVNRGGFEPPADLFDRVDTIVFSYLKAKYWAAFQMSELHQKYFGFMCIAEKPLTEDDFSLFRVLGRGGFGLVNGCKKCTSGKLYAMKVMDKRRIKLKKSETLCVNERNILAMVDSPFIVCLKYAFASKTELFLILDLMTGGDLGFHLHRLGRFPIDQAKFYAARTLLGLAALHERNIVYRDLKPDNILMDDNGYTRLSDLGLACKVPTNGLAGACGTRGYWAPEMIRRDAQGKRLRYFLTVDWFSFGCVVYEFLVGVSPFRTEAAKRWGGATSKAERDKAIDDATIEMEPVFDDSFDPVAKDLCAQLLEKDPSKRLGRNGAQEVMAHPFFGSINWVDFKHSKVKPPLVPNRDLNMASQAEIGMFSDDKQSRKLDLTEADQAVFNKWIFVNKKAFQDEVVGFMRYEELNGPVKVVNPNNTCCTIM